jgi:uncharacterized protein (DUF427 family)
MVKVELDGTLLAESDTTIVVEGNHYFPSDSIKSEYFSSSGTQCVSASAMLL